MISFMICKDKDPVVKTAATETTVEKTEETDVCKKNVVFFSGVCINMCSIPICSAGGSNADC